MFGRTKTSSTTEKCQKEKEKIKKENSNEKAIVGCAYTHEYLNLPPEFLIYRVFEIFRDISLNPQIESS